VFAIEPFAAADRLHVALNVSVPPLAAMLFVDVAMLPLPLADWHVPPLDALQVQVQPDSSLGENVSLMPTPPTATLAGFVAVIV